MDSQVSLVNILNRVHCLQPPLHLINPESNKGEESLRAVDSLPAPTGEAGNKETILLWLVRLPWADI